MNYPIILRLLGTILAIVELAFIASLAVAFYYKEYAQPESTVWTWLALIALLLLIMLSLIYAGKGSTTKIMRKEALCVIGVGWILASLIGALPYYFIIDSFSVGDALFESTSGLTTTGASLVEEIEILPHSLLFWRCISQWIGGLGVVVFFVAILSSLGAGAKMLFSNESSSHSTEVDSSRIQQGVLWILILYLGLSVICFFSLNFAGMGYFDALCHTFAAISTGGFSTYTASVAYFNSPLIEYLLVLFMFLGGTSFVLMLKALRGDCLTVRYNDEFIVYIGFILLFTVLLTMMLTAEQGIESLNTCFRHSLFQVISIMSTTGYSSVDYNQWLPLGHIVLLSCMLIGGCAGSTSGGIKVVRVVFALRLCLSRIEKSYRIRVVRPIRVNNRYVSTEDQENLLLYIVLIAVVALCSMLIIAIFEYKTSAAGIISMSLASIFNIGPGLNEIGPANNYAYVHEYTKYFLSLLMIMGRLELYAILALFAPSLWRHFS